MRKLLMLLLITVSVNAAQLGINEHQGAMVPLDLTFINEKGEKVTLEKLMDGKPTMITLNYFRCAGICGPQLADMAKMLSKLDLAENTDYKVLTISFAENETPDLASAKRQAYLHSMTRPFVQDAWHFLISDNNSSAILADKVGFTYKKEVSKAGVVDYVHPGALIMLSPKGKVTRYLNGIGQLPFDVKMAVIEAGEGKVGPTIAKKLLFCFAYDPKGKTYIFKWEKVVGALMTLIMIAFFIYLIKTSKRKEDNHQEKGEN
ncbi:MAG TPA: SCO family protein [Epsilonproteobacteria bacterium]|nr:SCO family protein [Campylobacterota bacterium]